MKLSFDLKKLLDEVRADPSFTRYQSVGRELAKVDWASLDVPKEQQVRLALQSSFTLEHLLPYLHIGCLQVGLVPEIHLGGFNQYQQALLDPRSDLYAFQPNITFLLLELQSLLPGVGLKPLMQADIDSVLERISSLTETYLKYAPGILVIGDFILPHRFPFSLRVGDVENGYPQLNQAIASHFQGNARVFVAGINSLASYHGVSRVSNAKLRLLASMAWSETFLPQVAYLCLAYVKALKGKTRKCLVMDLDNTLWGGVVGDEGLEGIRLAPEGIGKAYYEFQETIRALYDKGVILAVNSKNNYEDAIEVIRQHPHMLLRETHFGSLQINWDDKVTNMCRIAEDLNIGLDSLVFIDDSPQERLLVQQKLPEVLTVELPTDPALYSATLEVLNEFDQLYVTEEDRERGKMYAAQRSRRDLENRTASLDEYLDSLKMKLVLRPANAADLDRVHQLIQRTNQFNLTTRRYSRTELEDFMSSPEFQVYSLRVSDVFGDNGLTGVVVVRNKKREWTLDSFVLSCRIMGRTIEYEVLNQIVLDAQFAGASVILGKYIPTPKNKPVADLYACYGFHQVPGDDDGTSWELSISDLSVVPLSRFQVQR